MADRPLARRKLIKILRGIGVTEHTRRGTSHRALRGQVEGRAVQYSLPYHGSNETIQPSVIKAIRNRFTLLLEDGVSDKQFYGD